MWTEMLVLLSEGRKYKKGILDHSMEGNISA